MTKSERSERPNTQPPIPNTQNMILQITTTHQPATDLGYLLGKHPERFQTKELSFGKAHVFFPTANAHTCTAALLLDLNSIDLARQYQEQTRGRDVTLAHYVNDRPYVVSSFFTTAIAKVFSSALNGNCRDKPELVDKKIPLKAHIAALPVRGGEAILRKFFEPLGYALTVANAPLDEAFEGWGNSPYFEVTLEQTTTLKELLQHLYVLIPALDNNKHYYVSRNEVDKLIAKGGEWLKQHPEQEVITRRYLKYRKSYAQEALEQLVGEQTAANATLGDAQEKKLEQSPSVHQLRLQTVLDAIKRSGAQSVIDLGCGGGKLMRMLIKEKQFEKILGMDVSVQALEIAKKRIYYDNLSPTAKERIQLIHGSLTYVDHRLEGFDAAALVEVIEHLDEPRLAALQEVVFGFAQPQTVVITTPNVEYNVLFDGLAAGKMRHSDHRFEWTRGEFQAWGDQVAQTYGYTAEYLPVGEEHPEHGALTQMAIFTKIN